MNNDYSDLTAVKKGKSKWWALAYDVIAFISDVIDGLSLCVLVFGGMAWLMDNINSMWNMFNV